MNNLEQMDRQDRIFALAVLIIAAITVAAIVL